VTELSDPDGMRATRLDCPHCHAYVIHHCPQIDDEPVPTPVGPGSTPEGRAAALAEIRRTLTAARRHHQETS
jgi:hypothetical protein